MKNKSTCRYPHCNEIWHLGGLCSKHYEEGRAKEELRGEAVRSLHWGVIDGVRPSNEVARSELVKIQRWWNEVCNALNFGHKHSVLRDEVEFAKEWCIALAEQIVNIERAFRAGTLRETDDMFVATQLWVWERFENLEKGLKSNGAIRQKIR